MNQVNWYPEILKLDGGEREDEEESARTREMEREVIRLRVSELFCYFRGFMTWSVSEEICTFSSSLCPPSIVI